MARACSLDVPELRRILRRRQRTANADLQPYLSNLEQQLKSWDAGGNRAHLRGAIERTILEIEKQTDFRPLIAAFAAREDEPQPAA
jgi:hypothetical protein